MSALPARPSLEFDRKQAKRLLSAIRKRDPSALERFCGQHPRFSQPDKVGDVGLSDVHLVLAREYGFSSWPRWKQFVEFSMLNETQKIDRFLFSVCSNEVGMAARLLEIDDTMVAGDVNAAAAAGNVEAVVRLIEREPDLVTRAGGPLSTTPLAYACQSRLLVIDEARRDGIVECARVLLEAGADPDAWFLQSGEKDPDHRQTALYGAAGIANHVNLTRMLLEAGADPNDGLEAGMGETLYHAAEFQDTSCLRLVLAARPRQETIDYCLSRALDFQAPDAALVFLLFNANVDYRVSWFDNQTHLMKAIGQQCDPQLLKSMVLKSKDLDARDDNGLAAFQYAVRAGLEEIAAFIATHGGSTRVTAVDVALGACQRGDSVALDAIMASNPTIAVALTGYDMEALPRAARRLNHAALPLLAKLGIPIDHGSEMPALHQSCFCGDLRGVSVLLDLGASIDTVNSHGGSALSTAIYGSVNCHDVSGGPMSLPPVLVAERDYAAIVELLIRRGAKLPAQVGGSKAVVEVLQRCGVG